MSKDLNSLLHLDNRKLEKATLSYRFPDPRLIFPVRFAKIPYYLRAGNWATNTLSYRAFSQGMSCGDAFAADCN